MLVLSDRLIDVPVMSLQTGAELARTSQVIIDPRNLFITAFYVEGPQLPDEVSILHVSDIREIAEMGLIVDNSDVIMPLNDLVRLQEIIDLGFEPIGMHVYDEQGKNLGKVSDYAFEPNSFYIQQIYTHQSLLRNLTTASSIIGRDQIVAITKDKIVVQSPTEADTASETAAHAAEFVNPFRSPGGHPETNQSTRR